MGLERAAGFIRNISQGSSPMQEVQGPIHGERYRRELKIKEFGEPETLSTLPKSERRAFSRLVRATRRWAQVYQIQEGPNIRANFYPPRVTENQVKKAAEENPEILSPYTVVLKDDDGSLYTVPMNEAYTNVIERTGILDLLNDAAKLTKDKKLRDYLQAKMRAMKTGSWEEAERIWLEREDEPDIDIVIGFYDTYSDKFLGVKNAAQAWTGVLKREETKELQAYTDTFVDSWSARMGGVRPRVKVRVDDTSVKSGQAARDDLVWTGNNLPNQMEWRRKYGSKYTVFYPTFSDLFEVKADAFEKYIHPSRRSGIPKHILKSGLLRNRAAHEAGHSLVPDGIADRIGSHKNWFVEYVADLIAIDGNFEIPEVYDHNREHEVAFAMHFASGFVNYEEFKRTGKENVYLPSHTIIMATCLESGALQVQDGSLVWKDVSSVRKVIRESTEEALKLARDANVKDIEEFKSRRFNTSVFEKVIQSAS